MNFKEKVQSMKFSEIMQAMITGLQKEHVKVDMDVFGDLRMPTKICIGCAATNTICEISGKVFKPINISDRDDRAKYIKTDIEFLKSFELAIDRLRTNMLRMYNHYSDIINIALIPDEYWNDLYCLPSLYTDTYKEDLPQWQKVCDEIKEAGY